MMNSAQLQYLPMRLSFLFERPITFEIYPLFLMRSLLGRALHSMVCIEKHKQCNSCSHNQECMYVRIFNRIVTKENNVLNGSNTVSQPFVLSSKMNSSGPYKEYEFTITLLGNAVELAPYIYAAYERGGRWGVGRHRIKYSVKNAFAGASTLIHDGVMESSSFVRTVTIPDRKEIAASKERELMISLTSPLRFKYGEKTALL